MNVSVEVFKNKKSGKYLICRIEVERRDVQYYYGQEAPHRTHRWLSNEQWAEFDETIHKHNSKNLLNDLPKPLKCKLNGFSLKLKNSKIPREIILQILNNKDLKLEDISNVIDCKIQYKNFDQNHVGFKSKESKEGIDFLEHVRSPTVLPTQNILPEIAPTTETAADRRSPLIFVQEQSQSSVKSSDTTGLDTSNETERIERIFSNSMQLFVSPTTVNVNQIASPWSATKDINDNENCQDLEALPTRVIETRKRKGKSSSSIASSSNEKTPADCLKTPKTISKRLKRSSSKSTKKKNKNEFSNSPCRQEKCSLNTWLSKGDGKANEKSASKSNSKNSNTSPQSHMNKIEVEKSTSNPNPNQQTVEHALPKKEEIEKVREERQQVENIRHVLIKEPAKVRTLDLLKVSETELLETFDSHRADLEKIFKEQNSLKKIRCIDGVDYFLVINLVDNKIQQKLMEKLSDAFEKKSYGTPMFGELFSMILMPEWILRVFMFKHKMTRKEAIDHIKLQNEYKAFNSVSFQEIYKTLTKKK